MVNPSLCNQSFMRASFLHFSLLDDNDIICLLDGLESMSDDDDGAVLKESIKGLGDLLFGEGVKCTGGLIEEDDGRIFEENLGNGESLFLSATQPDSPFTNLGIKSLLEIEDKVTVGKTKGFDEFCFLKLL